MANAPVEHSLSVCVFKPDAVLFSTIIPGCQHDDAEALRALRHPESPRSTFRFYAYDFDSQRETVTFITQNGRFVFYASDGKLRRIGE